MSDGTGATHVAELESVDYLTEGGPDLAPGLPERVTRLQVDLVTRSASLSRHQPTSDAGGEPLGTFRATLTPELAARLRTALAQANLGQIVPGEGGGPGTSFIQIRTRSGGQIQEVGFASRDMETLAKLRDLLSLLNDAVWFVAQHPFQAIQIGLASRPGPDLTFSVAIQNVGTETVAVPDLAMLGREPQDLPEHGLGVRVAYKPHVPPGYTEPPLVWSRVAMATGADAAGKPFVLAPGEAHTFQAVVSNNKPHTKGSALVQAFFWFYSGPPTLDGRYLIRGHARSTIVKVPRS